MTENTDAPAPLAEPPPEEDVTTTLYRAAIGPVSSAYYLPIFSRFEDANHAGISWNTAASLSTFNWLIFRKLWGPALAYAGAMCTVVVLVFGIGRLVFDLSDTLMGALILGFGLTAFVLPGLFGNAVFHTECRKRMGKALAAHAVLSDACQALTAQASTRRRALWLGGANLAFLLALGFGYTQMSALPGLVVMPHGALDVAQVGLVSGSVAQTGNPSASGVLTLASKPIDPTGSAAQVPTSAPATPLSTPMSAAAPTSSPTSAPTPSLAAVSGPPAGTASAATVVPTTAGTVTPPNRATAAQTTPASSPVVTVTKARTAASAQPPKDSSATPPTRTAARASEATKGTEKTYFVNVGLFAVASNAANAHAKLQMADLPSVTRELKTARGPLTRVRVGPFSSRAEAQMAVEKIKALELDAIIVQP